MAVKIKQRPEDFVVEEIPVKGRNGKYTVFWIQKKNIDMNHAIKILSKKLGVSVKYFGFAGTKDKRAVTMQRISVYDPKDEIYKKISGLSLKNIKIKNVSKGDKIRLGDLKGNKFNIILRNIKLSKKEINKRLENLFGELAKGIPNYFGVQRFGEIRPISHIVGRHIIKDEYECAVKTYLCRVFEAEPEEAKKARSFLLKNWNKTGFKRALELFPERFAYERSLLRYLIKKNDFKGAMSVFPKKLMRMFVYAYQSYIWNQVADYCIKNNIKVRSIPLIGCNTKLGRSRIEMKIKDIINNDGIKLEMFCKPKFIVYGSERSFLLKPKNMKIIKIFKDNYNKNKNAAEIEFTLKKGSYATVVLEEVIKCLQ